ncbi:hypothetical protein, partial [Salmonella enterica]|uniref:hypothetical protein n=1 Tax=Salmonella enterica TaxID=28901 RepID=UPI003CEB0603
MPAVAYALYLLGFATGGLTAIVGLIIAYAQREPAGAMARTHYTFLIRTFWMTIAWCLIGAVLFAVGTPLSFILIGLPLLAVAWLIWSLVAVWYAVRCIV